MAKIWYNSYKQIIFKYIENQYPNLLDKDDDIYNKKKQNYWINLSKAIDEYCKTNNIKYINYFYHKELVKNKKENNT